MVKGEKILLGTACFFTGVVVGFFISPIKKGICCGNNSGNYVGTKEELEDIIDKSVEENFEKSEEK